MLGMRVLKASHVLSGPAKLVWIEDWHLDLGPEGCWLSAAKLGQRLGMARDSVEVHRRNLTGLGLYQVLQLKGLGKSNGWIPIMPENFVPVGKKLDDAEIAVYASRLDRYLEGVESGTITPLKGDATNGVGNPATDGRVRDAIDGVVRHATSPSGGKGGSSSSPSSSPRGTYVPSPSAVREDDVADATRQDERMKDRRRGTA